MLKTYQFKTQCKGDIHCSKTANIILPGLVTKYRWTSLRVQNRIEVQMHPSMLVETTRVTEFEYYFACTRKCVKKYNLQLSPQSSHTCLFVCLGFNGTFSTNRLYCAI